MAIDREWLKQNAELPPMDDAVLDEFAAAAREVTYADGDVVYAEMGEFDDILLVVEGALAHQFALADFGQDNEDLKANKGEFSNAVSFITEAPNTVSCVAEGDVKALAWKADSWKEICDRHPEVGYKLAVQISAMMVRRLLRVNELLLDNVSWGLE